MLSYKSLINFSLRANFCRPFQINEFFSVKTLVEPPKKIFLRKITKFRLYLDGQDSSPASDGNGHVPQFRQWFLNVRVQKSTAIYGKKAKLDTKIGKLMQRH
jgi:hypothetical protein